MARWFSTLDSCLYPGVAEKKRNSHRSCPARMILRVLGALCVPYSNLGRPLRANGVATENTKSTERQGRQPTTSYRSDSNCPLPLVAKFCAREQASCR